MCRQLDKTDPKNKSRVERALTALPNPVEYVGHLLLSVLKLLGLSVHVVFRGALVIFLVFCQVLVVLVLFWLRFGRPRF
jgi:hypothetical protein